MENLLTYILQVNLLLGLIYLGYYFLLKGLTFYALNRVYFVIGSLYAFVYPFIDIKSWFTTNDGIQAVLLPNLLPTFDMPATSTSQVTLLDVIITVVAILALLFVVKLLTQLLSLLRIHLHSKNSSWQSYIFRNVVFPIVPFSFFNKIYIHKEQHQETELQDIFAHEIVHVRGHHTVDILLFEIILVVCWYNPFVWLMRKAVRQNLEYLTDQQVLNKGVDKQTYQYSLLHVTRQGVAVGMSNHFNFKTLKKRIMMMNKKRSSKLELSKYAFLLPVFLITGASFTVSKAENDIEKIVEKSQQTTVVSEPLQAKLKGEVGAILKETIGSNVLAIDTSKQEKEYPLLAPDFDRKQLEGKNLHYQIDGKLVSLDEFLNFPRTEIAAVDIYKDKEEILKKIGKDNSEGLFVLTSKKYEKGSQVEFVALNKNSIDTAKIKVIKGENLLMMFKANSHLPKQPFVQPLIVVDDIVKNLDFDMNSINVNDIESVSVLKDKSATAVYGDKGKDGVIVITTKKNLSSGSNQKDNDKVGLYLKSDNGSNTTKRSLDFRIEPNKSINDRPLEERPIFVIDDKAQDLDFDINTLNPNEIESVTVFKGSDEIAEYGENAKNGVIKIVTKKNASKAVVVTGHKSEKDKGDSIDVNTKETVKEVIVTGHKK